MQRHGQTQYTSSIALIALRDSFGLDCKRAYAFLRVSRNPVGRRLNDTATTSGQRDTPSDKEAIHDKRYPSAWRQRALVPDSREP